MSTLTDAIRRRIIDALEGDEGALAARTIADRIMPIIAPLIEEGEKMRRDASWGWDEAVEKVLQPIVERGAGSGAMTGICTQAKRLREFAEGHDEHRYYPEYSGKGMNGKTCIGISTPNALITLEAVTAEIGLRGGVIDELGKRKIVYWPMWTEAGPR
jgi:hypothetical protein